jgi:hypothetical protein
MIYSHPAGFSVTVTSQSIVGQESIQISMIQVISYASAFARPNASNSNVFSMFETGSDVSCRSRCSVARGFGQFLAISGKLRSLFVAPTVNCSFVSIYKLTNLAIGNEIFKRSGRSSCPVEIIEDTGEDRRADNKHVVLWPDAHQIECERSAHIAFFY